MITFSDETRVSGDRDALTATLSEEWGIWGPNGGILSAIALRAVGRVAEPGHRPATLSVQYLGRAEFGDIAVSVERVKGGGSACFNVAFAQGDKRFLQAQVWTTSRDAGPVAALAMPAVAARDCLETLAAYKTRVGDPEHPFWTHFDARPVGFTGPPNPDPRGHVLQQWTRFLGWPADADAFLDAARAALLIDTLVWPAFWRGCAVDPQIVAPSLDVAIWFHGPAAADDWLLADIDAGIAGAGLIHGSGRVWTADGRAVASG